MKLVVPAETSLIVTSILPILIQENVEERKAKKSSEESREKAQAGHEEGQKKCRLHLMKNQTRAMKLMEKKNKGKLKNKRNKSKILKILKPEKKYSNPFLPKVPIFSSSWKRLSRTKEAQKPSQKRESPQAQKKKIKFPHHQRNPNKNDIYLGTIIIETFSRLFLADYINKLTKSNVIVSEFLCAKNYELLLQNDMTILL